MRPGPTWVSIACSPSKQRGGDQGREPRRADRGLQILSLRSQIAREPVLLRERLSAWSVEGSFRVARSPGHKLALRTGDSHLHHKTARRAKRRLERIAARISGKLSRIWRLDVSCGMKYPPMPERGSHARCKRHNYRTQSPTRLSYLRCNGRGRQKET